MSEEYRVVGESPTKGTAGSEFLDSLVWEGPPTTKLGTVRDYASERRRLGDQNVKLERRGGPGAPWEAIGEDEE